MVPILLIRYNSDFMAATIIILILAIVFFVNGKIRSDIVALCALILLMSLGILTPTEGLSGFSNSAVIMMIGLFVVGGAIFQTGLAKMIGGKMMKLAGNNEVALFLLVVLTTAFIGAFLSNTGCVALMMPIVVSLAAKSHVNTSRLLIPLAYASSLGGMATLIGTPPNLIINDALTAGGYEPLGFFSFTPVGIICITVGVLVLLPLSKLLVKRGSGSDKKKQKTKTLAQLVKEYKLSDNLSSFEVTGKSGIDGQTLAELDVHNRYGLTVMEVRRETSPQGRIVKNVRQELAGPKTVIRNGDVLLINGERSQTEQFAKDYSLIEIQPGNGNGDAHSLEFYDIGIAEIVMLQTSRLVNHLIKDTDFRENYHVNIVGIRRKHEYIMENLANEQIHSGDVLLVQGAWTNISRLQTEINEWVVLGQPLEQAAKVTLDYKAPIAAVIMIAMICAMVFDFIPVAPVTAVLIAAVLMVLTGCFRNVEAAYKTINWETIVLIAAMMPMSIALEKTGVASVVSNGLVDILGGAGPHAVLAGIYLTTMVMTMFISNTATAVLMAPIAITAATQLGVSPYSFLLTVTVSASMCFASPFSTPPNALVMQAGNYEFMDYVKVGLPLQLLIGVAMIVLLPVLFPF